VMRRNYAVSLSFAAVLTIACIACAYLVVQSQTEDDAAAAVVLCGGGGACPPTLQNDGTIVVTDAEARHVADLADYRAKRLTKKMAKFTRKEKRALEGVKKLSDRSITDYGKDMTVKLSKVENRISRLKNFVKGQVAAIQSMEGPRGPEGGRGQTGPVGNVGPRGELGPRGVRGKVGPIGYVGPIGKQGPTGPQGHSDELECQMLTSERSGGWDDARVAVGCPNGWALTSCSAWSLNRHMDGAFMSGNACYAQNGEAEQGAYAKAICCKPKEKKAK